MSMNSQAYSIRTLADRQNLQTELVIANRRKETTGKGFGAKRREVLEQNRKRIMKQKLDVLALQDSEIGAEIASVAELAKASGDHDIVEVSRRCKQLKQAWGSAERKREEADNGAIRKFTEIGTPKVKARLK